jgi:hypothetical protein
MYEKSAFVFWVTLILYIITLSTVSYVGVYLTYIAIPIIVISGLIMMFFKPKPKTKEILDELSMFAKEVNQAKNKILNEVNSSLSQFNEKSELIRIKTEGLKARKHQLALQRIEPEINFKHEKTQFRRNELANMISNIDREIRDIDREINQIKIECELQVSRKYNK